MRNRALYLLLRAATRILPAFPLRLAYALAAGAGRVAYYGAGSARRGILTNLAIAFPDVSAREQRQMARAAFRHNALNWLDTLRIPSLRSDQILALVHLEGWEHVVTAAAAGNGVILVSMHLGNFDLVGQVVAARGMRLTVPVERVDPPELFEFLLRRRSSQGITLLPVEQAPRAMVHALKRGEVVGLTADRLVAGKSIVVNFFGKPALLPRGPVSLARHSGAAVLFGAGIRTHGEHFVGHIVPVPSRPLTDNVLDDELAMMTDIVAIMEDRIRRTPDQWLAFAPLWRSHDSHDLAATIGHQLEAAV